MLTSNGGSDIFKKLDLMEILFGENQLEGNLMI